MAKQNLALLTQPFPSEILEEKNGFTYVPQQYVKQRLNDALGVDGWSSEITETLYIEKEDSVLVCVRLTAYIEQEDGSVRAVVHEEWGGQKAVRSKNYEVSNDYKGAASDALKKAASDLGVAEDLYFKGNKGGAKKNVTRTTTPAAAPKAPAAAPKTPAAPTTPTAAQTNNAFPEEQIKRLKEFKAVMGIADNAALAPYVQKWAGDPEATAQSIRPNNIKQFCDYLEKVAGAR